MHEMRTDESSCASACAVMVIIEGANAVHFVESLSWFYALYSAKRLCTLSNAATATIPSHADADYQLLSWTTDGECTVSSWRRAASDWASSIRW